MPPARSARRRLPRAGSRRGRACVRRRRCATPESLRQRPGHLAASPAGSGTPRARQTTAVVPRRRCASPRRRSRCRCRSPRASMGRWDRTRRCGRPQPAAAAECRPAATLRRRPPPLRRRRPNDGTLPPPARRPLRHAGEDRRVGHRQADRRAPSSACSTRTSSPSTLRPWPCISPGGRRKAAHRLDWVVSRPRHARVKAWPRSAMWRPARRSRQGRSGEGPGEQVRAAQPPAAGIDGILLGARPTICSPGQGSVDRVTLTIHLNAPRSICPPLVFPAAVGNPPPGSPCGALTMAWVGRLSSPARCAAAARRLAATRSQGRRCRACGSPAAGRTGTGHADSSALALAAAASAPRHSPPSSHGLERGLARHRIRSRPVRARSDPRPPGADRSAATRSTAAWSSVSAWPSPTPPPR